MSKSPDAFRTISEVADWLGLQPHVLRFWESKFSQVKPIKRAGGRRYYRPADMLLIGGLKKLLHEDGLTIKGAQKLLREQGVAHVADMSQPLDDLTMAALDEDTVPEAAEPAFAARAAAAGETATTDDAAQGEMPAEAAAASRESSQDAEPETEAEAAAADATGDTEVAQEFTAEDDPATKTGETAGDPAFEFTSVAEAKTGGRDAAAEASEAATPHSGDDPASEAEDDPQRAGPADAPAGETADLPDFLTKPLQETGEDKAGVEDTGAAAATRDNATDAPPTEQANGDKASGEPAGEDDAERGRFTVTPPVAPTRPVRPADVDVPPVPAEEDIEAPPSALTALSQLRRIDPGHARRIRPLLEQLVALRADLAGPGKDAGKD